MNTKSTKVLATIGVALVTASSAVQFSNSLSILPFFDFYAVLTIWTLASLLCLFSFFLTIDLFKKRFCIYGAVASQMISVCILISGITPAISLLLPSSATTTTYILLVASTLASRENHRLHKIQHLLIPFCIFLPLFFFFSTMYSRHDFLGVSDAMKGVGTSPYTTLCFILIAAIIIKTFYTRLDLRIINISLRPIICFTIAITFFFVKILIPPHNFKNFYVMSLTLDAFVLAAIYWFVIHPISYRPEKCVVMCSWTKKVKLANEQWVHADEFLRSIGIPVSHGADPEALQKIREAKGTES